MFLTLNVSNMVDICTLNTPYTNYNAEKSKINPRVHTIGRYTNFKIVMAIDPLYIAS
jgi:hypothetical protein